MWTLVTTLATAAEPSLALQAVTGTGLVVGTAGAALTGLGLTFYGTPEPYGLILLGGSGLFLVTTGATLAVGGSLWQGARLDAPLEAGLAGAALLGAGVVTFAVGAASETEVGGAIALFGGPALAVGGLVAAGFQGGTNLRHGEPRVAVLPDPRRRGLVLVGSF